MLKVASGETVDSAQGVVYVVKASMFDAANRLLEPKQQHEAKRSVGDLGESCSQIRRLTNEKD